MSHTLEQIKTDLSSRLTSEEYLPDFISRDGDLTIFADSMAEFVAPYAKQLEDIENLYNDVDILRNYLLSKGLYLLGDESAFELQDIANERIKIFAQRGTISSVTELRRLCADVSTDTDISVIETAGWVARRVSPCYRTSSTELNFCFLNAREMNIFILKNSSFLSNNDLTKIIKKYFEVKTIRNYYKFI